METEGDLTQAPATPADLAVTAAVGQLPAYRSVLAWDAAGADAEAAFNSVADLPGLLVVKAGALRGLLSRQRFMELMTHAFARELYLGRPLSRLPDEIWPEPLIVDEDGSVAEVAHRALSRPLGQSYDPLVVRCSGGVLQVLDMRVLLLAQGQVLARYAASLETTLDALRRAQDNLVEARKMAALGSLVAGIAHEVNTPTGLALTAVTHLRALTAEILEKFRAGTMKRSDLDRYLGQADEDGSHIEVNVARAAELIRSFKQVAVDQTSQERRSFALRPYIEAVLFSLRPRLKHLPHRIEVECPAELAMDSYPGALAQILSNLVLNAVIHAFPDGRAGTIRIAARSDGGMVDLSVADDGCGIPAEHLPHIFDPFFTTRRTDGGSGLGLSIVYNLATHALGGEVRCESAVGKGSCFSLRLPCEGPRP